MKEKENVNPPAVDAVVSKFKARFVREEKAKAARRKVFGYCSSKGELTDNLILLPDFDIEACKAFLKRQVSEIYNHCFCLESDGVASVDKERLAFMADLSIAYLGVFHSDTLRFSNEPHPQCLFRLGDVFDMMKEVRK